uniref:Ovule protein n=1 Tax=Ascaris lumbricoides TaxID=6252 RepID=A0A0M3IFJ1_ASCLU
MHSCTNKRQFFENKVYGKLCTFAYAVSALPSLMLPFTSLFNVVSWKRSLFSKSHLFQPSFSSAINCADLLDRTVSILVRFLCHRRPSSVPSTLGSTSMNGNHSLPQGTCL